MKQATKPKILLWDTEICGEVRGANFSFVICIAYKWLGERKTHLISLRDFPTAYEKDRTNDKLLLKAFSKIYVQADQVVTWYGKRFDEKLVATRAMIHGLPPIPRPPHFDGWEKARYDFHFTRNSLATVAQALGTPEQKTHVDLMTFLRAGCGIPKALATVERRCISDVKVLEMVYLKMRPYSRQVPNMSAHLSKQGARCPACASSHIQSRGVRKDNVTPRLRMQCQSCGHWFCTSTKLVLKGAGNGRRS